MNDSKLVKTSIGKVIWQRRTFGVVTFCLSLVLMGGVSWTTPVDESDIDLPAGCVIRATKTSAERRCTCAAGYASNSRHCSIGFRVTVEDVQRFGDVFGRQTADSRVSSFVDETTDEWKP